MRKMKRLTAWLLVICMAFSHVSLTVAEDTSGTKIGSGIYSVDSDFEQYLLIDPDMPDVLTDVSLTERTVPFYVPMRCASPEKPADYMQQAVLYFPENMPSVPYLEVGDAMSMYFIRGRIRRNAMSWNAWTRPS